MENEQNTNSGISDKKVENTKLPMGNSSLAKHGNTKFALLIIAILAIIGVLVIKNSKSQSLRSESPTQIKSEQLENWETYVGKEYSFKYPKGLASDTKSGGEGTESIKFQFVGPKQATSGKIQTSLFDGYSFMIAKLGSASEKTPEQWADERRKGLIETCQEGFTLSETQQITIDNENAVQYKVKDCIGAYTTNSYVSHGGYVYEISQLYTGEEPEINNYEKITDKIRFSVKFSDASTKVD